MSVELGQILLERDFSMIVDYPMKTKNTLSRGELEDICQHVLGQNVPNETVRFIVKSLDNKYFLVMYIKPWDKFLWNKMKVR